jgi:hypothetical protein
MGGVAPAFGTRELLRQEPTRRFVAKSGGSLLAGDVARTVPHRNPPRLKHFRAPPGSQHNHRKVEGTASRSEIRFST